MPRDLDQADALVRRTLDIIRFFKPERWFLVNPRNGLLKTRPYMEGIPFVTWIIASLRSGATKSPPAYGAGHMCWSFEVACATHTHVCKLLTTLMVTGGISIPSVAITSRPAEQTSAGYPQVLCGTCWRCRKWRTSKRCGKAWNR